MDVRTCENWAEVKCVEGSSLKESNGDCASHTVGIPSDIER